MSEREIRKIQNNSNFNDEIAHKLALLAMAQYGYFLTTINSNIKIIICNKNDIFII